MDVDHYLSLGNRRIFDATDAAAVVFQNGYPEIVARHEYQPEHTVRKSSRYITLFGFGLSHLVLKARHVWQIIHHTLVLKPAMYYVDGFSFGCDRTTVFQYRKLRELGFSFWDFKLSRKALRSIEELIRSQVTSFHGFSNALTDVLRATILRCGRISIKNHWSGSAIDKRTYWQIRTFQIFAGNPPPLMRGASSGDPAEWKKSRQRENGNAFLWESGGRTGCQSEAHPSRPCARRKKGGATTRHARGGNDGSRSGPCQRKHRSGAQAGASTCYRSKNLREKAL